MRMNYLNSSHDSYSYLFFCSMDTNVLHRIPLSALSLQSRTLSILEMNTIMQTTLSIMIMIQNNFPNITKLGSCNCILRF